MPPIKHALLGASSAARWIACAPSARATENLPDEETKYAAEGTRAHELCEYTLRHNLAGWKGGKPFDPMYDWYGGEGTVTPEMLKAANQYVSFIHDLWVGYAVRPMVFIEQEVDVSRWVPGGFGTCDCLMIGDGILHIIDFKYGQGVPVSPERNPQLMYYALGAYALFEGIEGIGTVCMSIVQPRMQEEPQTWELPLADLLGTDPNLVADEVETAIEAGRAIRLMETTLDERENEVVRLRYGLTDGEPLPQHEVARRLGISRSYVSRIEKRALEKLRRALER